MQKIEKEIAPTSKLKEQVDKYISTKNTYITWYNGIHMKIERTDKEYVRFYSTKEWELVRLLALQRDNYLCVRCRAKGIIKLAEMVHHKTPIKVDYNKRANLSNLESLCEACHNATDHTPHHLKPSIIHPRKRPPAMCVKSHN